MAPISTPTVAHAAAESDQGNSRQRMKTRTAFTHSSTAQSAALALAAVVMLVPAYALPVMHLRTLGEPAVDTTILSGIIQLWRDGLAGLAAIVFTASFLVPLL